MDTIRAGRRLDQLNKRREQVLMTQEHIEKERKEVEENSDWLDRAAYDSRIALFDRLNEWYTQENDAIDKALDRVKQSNYGFCRACHNAIEVHRLDLFPEAAFCAACQEVREGLQRV